MDFVAAFTSCPAHLVLSNYLKSSQDVKSQTNSLLRQILFFFFKERTLLSVWSPDMCNNSWPLVGLFKKWLQFFSSLILILKHHVCFSVLTLSGLCLVFFVCFFFSASAGFIKVQLVKAHGPYAEKDRRLGFMLCCPRIHNTLILELVFCRGPSVERPSRRVVRGQTDGMGWHCVCLFPPHSPRVFIRAWHSEDPGLGVWEWGSKQCGPHHRVNGPLAAPRCQNLLKCREKAMGFWGTWMIGDLSRSFSLTLFLCVCCYLHGK